MKRNSKLGFRLKSVGLSTLSKSLCWVVGPLSCVPWEREVVSVLPQRGAGVSGKVSKRMKTSCFGIKVGTLACQLSVGFTSTAQPIKR